MRTEGTQRFEAKRTKSERTAHQTSSALKRVVLGQPWVVCARFKDYAFTCSRGRASGSARARRYAKIWSKTEKEKAHGASVPLCAEELEVPLVAGRSCCRFGLHIHEVVEITEWHGAEPVIGLVDDTDAKWGLMAIVSSPGGTAKGRI